MKLQKTLLAFALAGLLATPAIALADFASDVTEFGGTAAGTDIGAVVTAITTIVNALLTVVAIIAVVFVVIGGVRYITSQGDEDAVALAKNTIIYSIVGVIVILLSAVIINIFLGLL